MPPLFPDLNNLDRLGEPDEVAQVVLMVVGNGFVTGQTIAVNGGVSFI